MIYEPQVTRGHYEGRAYRSSDRWISYWHQIALIHRTGVQNILEIGLGEGTVARELRARGMEVTTLDIAKDLNPDVVGSVTDIPLPDASFDAVLAAEILEHIRFEDVPQALKEIARVTRSYAIITLPHPGYVFSAIFKVPFIRRIGALAQIPFFWKSHIFNGEHYWELGKKGFPVSRFVREAATAGLKLERLEKHADDPAHRAFLFKKASE